jgi:hypothetical protein
MRKLEKMPDTRWLGFHNPTGTWRFRVEHFSRYGLLDDDSDENDEADGVVPKNAPPSSHKKVLSLKEDSMEEEFHDEDVDTSVFQDSILHTSGKPGRVHFLVSEKIEEESEELEEDKDILEDEYDEEYFSGEYDSLAEEEQEEEFEEDEFDEEEEVLSEESESENVAPDSVMIVDRAAELGKKELARRVQGMKVANMFASIEKKPVHVVPKEASYFGSAPLEFKIDNFKGAKVSPDAAKSTKRMDVSLDKPSSIAKRTDFSKTSSGEPGLVSPRKYFKSKSTIGKGIPYKDSVTFKKEKQLVDSGLFMARSFRVGWGPGGVFIVNNG